ncbi:HK97 family phage prohead protease [Faecalispora jeddahensis]|uniref:HK97 family phage prohead protease n=1 Tax=Faecalispora jeddahensis TaxID=1414721 RepID=UPI0027B8985D|nr:HK97 family phage prohead protease [Faecalispora jeddahensis]
MIERLTRSFEIEPLLPEGESTNSYKIEGRAIHYAAPALIRGVGQNGKITEWYEIIDPAALGACDVSDVPMLLEHDRKEVIARSRGGSLQFDNRPDGLYIAAKMLTQKGREVWESVRAGLLTAFSFAFPVDSRIVRDGTHEGLPLMHVMEIRKLLDVSVVFNPAYQGTFANARSADMVETMLHNERTKQKIRILLEDMKHEPYKRN